MRRDERHVTRRVVNMFVDGRQKREQPKQGWMGCVNEDRRMKEVSGDMTAVSSLWKVSTCYADQTYRG